MKSRHDFFNWFEPYGTFIELPNQGLALSPAHSFEHRRFSRLLKCVPLLLIPMLIAWESA